LGADGQSRQYPAGQAIDPTPPNLLVTFDDPTRRSLRREFAADGRRFYFTIANDESDLWTMQVIAK